MNTTIVNVTGHVINPDGTDTAGKISFKASAEMRNTQDLLITAREADIATLVNGQFSVHLAATEDSATLPAGVEYDINVVGLVKLSTALPHAVNPVDFSTLPY